MEIITTAFLAAHIAMGTTALICGAIALSTLKGGGIHKRVGRVYFWSMFGVLVTAMALAILRPNLFLFLLAIFSFYMAFSGTRRTRMKQPAKPGVIAPLDWTIGIVTLITGTGMIAVSLIDVTTFALHWNPILGSVSVTRNAVTIKDVIQSAAMNPL